MSSHLILTSLFPLSSPFCLTSLFLLLLPPSFVQCQVLVVPSFQMARSDHLLMTVEQRKAFPAAAAWRPAQYAHTQVNTNTHIHTMTHTHACSYWNRLTPCRTDIDPCRQNFLYLFALSHVSALLYSPVTRDSVLHFCTLSLPSPPSSCLQLSLFHLLLWCY